MSPCFVRGWGQRHFLPGIDGRNSELLGVPDPCDAIGSFLLEMAGIAWWQHETALILALVYLWVLPLLTVLRSGCVQGSGTSVFCMRFMFALYLSLGSFSPLGFCSAKNQTVMVFWAEEWFPTMEKTVPQTLLRAITCYRAGCSWDNI